MVDNIKIHLNPLLLHIQYRPHATSRVQLSASEITRECRPNYVRVRVKSLPSASEITHKYKANNEWMDGWMHA